MLCIECKNHNYHHEYVNWPFCQLTLIRIIIIINSKGQMA
jgi:hypothetical protein